MKKEVDIFRISKCFQRVSRTRKKNKWDNIITTRYEVRVKHLIQMNYQERACNKEVTLELPSFPAMGRSQGQGLFQAEGIAGAKAWRLESVFVVGGETRCPV